MKRALLQRILLVRHSMDVSDNTYKIRTPEAAQGAVNVLTVLRSSIADADPQERFDLMRTYGLSIPELDTAIAKIGKHCEALNGMDYRKVLENRNACFTEARRERDYRDLRRADLRHAKDGKPRASGRSM